MQKGATPAIRAFGRWMYTDHGLTANAWLQAIVGEMHENIQPTLTPEDRALHQKLSGLSGSRFDEAYIQSQVTDHEKTIPLFEREARDGSNPMVKNFARGLVPVLRQHLAEAKELAGTVGVAAAGGAAAAERSGSSMPPR
jgi:putative membrane protein